MNAFKQFKTSILAFTAAFVAFTLGTSSFAQAQASDAAGMQMSAISIEDLDAETKAELRKIENLVREGLQNYAKEMNSSDTQNVYYRTQISLDSKVNISVLYSAEPVIFYRPSTGDLKASLEFSLVSARSLLRSQDSIQQNLYKSIWDKLYPRKPTSIRIDGEIVNTTINSTALSNESFKWNLNISPGMNSSVISGFTID